jgi:hypothetical protein
MSSRRSCRHYLVSSTAQWCRIAITDCDGATIATWTVGGAGAPDFAVVDTIARIHLDAKVRGQTVVLSAVAPDLAALICLAGLADVLATPPG